MWRYISDAATRFVTSVWNSLTFIFNLIPAPFVLLSINYKLLTFKNIFAFARAGFGSYSDLKMLANAVLVEKKEEDAAATAAWGASPQEPVLRHPHQRHRGLSSRRGYEGQEGLTDDEVERRQERVQKQKAEMFEEATLGADKTKFAKDDFASIVRATGLLKGTKFYEVVDQNGDVVLDEHGSHEINAVGEMRLLILARSNAEVLAKVYLICERLAKLTAVHPRLIYNNMLDANRETFGYHRTQLSSPQSKLLLDRIIAGEVTLNKYIPKEMLDRLAKRVQDFSIVIKALGAMMGQDVQVSSLVLPIMQATCAVVSGLLEKSGAATHFRTAFAPSRSYQQDADSPFSDTATATANRGSGAAPSASAAYGGDETRVDPLGFVAPRDGVAGGGDRGRSMQASQQYGGGGGGGLGWGDDDRALHHRTGVGGVARPMSTLRQPQSRQVLPSVPAPFVAAYPSHGGGDSRDPAGTTRAPGLRAGRRGEE